MERRPRRLIVHAGMHKTGSTAIQHWLHTAKLRDVHYFKWRTANHSELFVLLFEDDPQEYFALASGSYTHEDAMRERAREMESLRTQIEGSDRDVFVFSAERISAAPDEAVQRMHDYFAAFFAEIEVYAYVRKPSGFMTSMFQQHLKTGRIKFGYGPLWPGYKRRLERLDRIFGEDNVHLRSFDALLQSGTEAVGDFARWVGIDAVPPGNIVRNTSLSAAGVALLYFYRDVIEPEVPEALRKSQERRVVSLVQNVPGGRFHLELTPTAAQRERALKDLGWITSRTGFDFSEGGAAPQGAQVFRSEDDILDLAIRESHKLLPDRNLPVLDPGPEGREETVRRFRKALSQPGWLRRARGILRGTRHRG